MQPEGVKSQFSTLWAALSDGFDYSLRTLASGTCQDPANSSQNPDNDFFQIPQYLADLELRPDFYLNFKLLELSAKPRVSLEWRGWEEGDREGETDWDDRKPVYFLWQGKPAMGAFLSLFTFQSFLPR